MPEAAKITILERAPKVVNIVALPTAVTGIVGVCERGSIGTATLATSWGEWVNTFGSFATSCDAAVAAYGFFLNGGQQLWTVRTCHYTDITDASTSTAVAATLNIANAGTTATSASVTSTGSQNFTLADGDTLTATVDGNPETATFNAAAGYQDSNLGAWPVANQDGLTLILAFNGGSSQTVTFAGVGGVYSAAEYAAQINAGIVGGFAQVIGGEVRITSDQKGTGSSVNVSGGTTTVTFAAAVAGTGDAVNAASVTGTELKTLVEADFVTGVTITVNGGGTLTLATVSTGSGATLQVTGGAINTAVAWDTNAHVGVDAGATNTIQVDAKTPGAWANLVKIIIAAASSTVSSEFNLQVEVNGTIEETWKNITMDDTQLNFCETVLNNADTGSNYITVTDLDAGGTPLTDRPANGTHGYMAGGNSGLGAIADTDFVGDSAGKTGLYGLDVVSSLRLVAIPEKASATVYSGLTTYCETAREYGCFAVLATPTLASVATVAALKTFVETTTAIKGTSEYIALYWPRIKIANVDKAVYGQLDYQYADPSAWICGVMARVDDTINGGVYEAPAGIEQNMGKINGCIGLEATETDDLEKREILAAMLVCPITHVDSAIYSGYIIDGSWTMKTTGNFPYIPQVRGKINIAETLKNNLEWVKHRRNTKRLRARVTRSITRYLDRELAKDAFASDVPEEAYQVQCDDKNNPPAVASAGQLKIYVGLNFGTPIGPVEIEISKDTQAFEESQAA